MVFDLGLLENSLFFFVFLFLGSSGSVFSVTQVDCFCLQELEACNSGAALLELEGDISKQTRRPKIQVMTPVYLFFFLVVLPAIHTMTIYSSMPCGGTCGTTCGMTHLEDASSACFIVTVYLVY